MSVKILPTFNGYTVDIRLREFRKVAYGKSIEFISFDSPKGQQLLKELKELENKVRNNKKSELGELFQRAGALQPFFASQKE